MCPHYPTDNGLHSLSHAACWPFQRVCLCKQHSIEIISKGNDESSSRRFTGPPKLSRLAAASLSRKKKNTKRIKECAQRTDETLAIRVCRIRQNAGWQRHILFFCSPKPRKKKSCLFLKVRRAGSRQHRRALTRVSEWVTGSISPSAAHVGTSVTLRSEQWSVVAPIGGEWQIAGILCPSDPLSVCFTCGVICRHFQMLKKEPSKYYSFISVWAQPVLKNLNAALRDQDLNYISSLPLSIIGVLKNFRVFWNYSHVFFVFFFIADTLLCSSGQTPGCTDCCFCHLSYIHAEALLCCSLHCSVQKTKCYSCFTSLHKAQKGALQRVVHDVKAPPTQSLCILHSLTIHYCRANKVYIRFDIWRSRIEQRGSLTFCGNHRQYQNSFIGTMGKHGYDNRGEKPYCILLYPVYWYFPNRSLLLVE